ncbi:MAG: hypothetical protein OXC62_14080 [Aestuariivita sp.]|nr:hypothetical protein [Aestuariivita sp.]
MDISYYNVGKYLGKSKRLARIKRGHIREKLAKRMAVLFSVDGHDGKFEEVMACQDRAWANGEL